MAFPTTTEPADPTTVAGITDTPGTPVRPAAPAGPGSSRYRGVAWDKQNRRWVVHICHNREQRHVGCFTDEFEAARAYDAEARKAFGEWASPNFPTETERAFAAQWYDRDRACRFFGVKRSVFKRWVREGKITGGRMVPSSCGGGKRRVFTREELERMRQEMFGADKLYKTSQGPYHVPPGFLQREEACNRFGVSIVVWWRWERLGWIRCGMRVPGGPKLYRVEDIERLIAEHGFLSPPYPDPDRPGVYRVPLGGHDITRREAIIDAESLPLIEGGTCSWSTTSEGLGCVVFHRRDEFHGTPLRRIVMGVAHTDLNVGHRNGDALDCRRENLEVKTALQRVRGKCKGTEVDGRPLTSRFKGVHWETYTGKWRAVIRAQGKSHSLGRFHDEIEAAEAYDIAARRYFGKHAWLNFPEGCERGRAEDTPERVAA